MRRAVLSLSGAPKILLTQASVARTTEFVVRVLSVPHGAITFTRLKTWPSSHFIAFQDNPGQSHSGSKSQSNNAPYINSFWESSWGTQGVATLEFTYHWTSSTGNLLDLSQCTIDEYVTSSLGTGTQSWPDPPWNYSETYPVPTPPKSEGEGWLPTDGFDSDFQLAGIFQKPYAAATFTNTQIFHFKSPGYNGGNWVTLAGPYSIVRSVSLNNGTWQYTVTKNDGHLTYNLP